MTEELLGLVEACQKGNKEAWELLVKQCGKIIRRYLLRYCGDKGEEINDITQQVWMKLLKGGIRGFRGTSQYQFLAYLKKITVNEANTYFRFPKPRTDQENNDDDETITAWPRLAVPLDAEGLPEERAYPEPPVIEVERLAGCLKGLPLVQQEIALMKAKDYKDTEIGEILGLSLGTVAVSYLRLKNKLRECMGGREK